MPPNVQLGLELDDLPAIPPLIVERLPEAAMAAATARLARLIAHAVADEARSPRTVSGGDDD